MAEKLKNAPIYFAIAQVRHNAILTIRDYLPAIQEGLRKTGYPDFTPTFAISFNIAAAVPEEAPQTKPPTPVQIERYLFLNLAKTRAFILDANAFSFQTTEYETYPEFSEEFFRGLEIVHKIIGLDFSERVGLRYLDAVSPLSKGEELWSYLKPGVAGLDQYLPQGLNNVAHSLSETVIATSEGNVTAKVIIRTGPLGFPLDLQPLGLQVADRFTRLNGHHAILDTDAAWQTREEFEIAPLRRRLAELHEISEGVFDATVTDHAKAAWR
jgi:uncharacterized protein (TIGR04255 family)